MRASNTSCKVDVFGPADPCRADVTRRRTPARIIGFLVVITLIVGSLYLGAAVSASSDVNNNPKEAVINKVKTQLPAITGILSSPTNIKSLAPMLNPQNPAPTVTTFAGDCTTGKTLFNVQDTDKTVCAKIENAAPGWFAIWSNANFISVQATALTSSNQNATFTLNANSNLGDWRVILFEPIGGGVYNSTAFTVVDAENALADLQIDTEAKSPAVAAGAQAVFAIQVTNGGPSTATNAEVTDAVPTNATFVSFAQLSGPVFTCTSPQEGNTGTTTCTIASLAKGETAQFLATYLIDNGVATGTEISNTASITSATADRVVAETENNSSTASVKVASTPCVIAAPENITTAADSGQAGAVVTYATPTFTGDCGGTSETPAISCNPQSGSFFPVGTTTVICAAEAGATATFQVTVDNPGALTISLNGANSITIECGQPFSDPGATAIDGGGQPIEVTVAYTGGFTADAPTAGTYTATYTATEGANSVSANRTIVVDDTVGPAITLEGANPYRIQQGSCSPFVDPGASAFDTCAGAKPVEVSISGPGGATFVNPAVAGTYIVTYTATDGTHSTTATRTVLVGTFDPDEVDQPSGSNQPPTIVLNGDPQIHIECGTAFTDPGATASVCGSPVNVTTTGTVDIHTPGVYSLTYSATANGQTVDVTRIVTVEADNTAPTITLNGANPMTVFHQATFTDPGATAHDACAGDFPATATGTVDTDTVGTYVITYNATDPSGHAATPVTRTVNVVYNFSGFFSPVSNLPTLNIVSAGRAIPVKFSLNGNKGLNIFAAGSPYTISINCDGSAPQSDIEETVTAGGSSLSYDAASDRYIYTWKTENSWVNTCRQLVIVLNDGTEHRASFKFK